MSESTFVQPADGAASAQASLAEAVAHEEAGRLEEAAAALDRLIETAPSFHQAMMQAGIVAHKRGRPSEALDHFKRASNLAPDNAIYHRNLCELYRGFGRLDEAVSHGRRAAELSPGDPLSHYNLGIVHYDRQDIAAALSAQRRALELNPQMPAAHFELAEALLLTGQFAEGWEEYEWRFRLANVPPLLPQGDDHTQWDGRAMPDKTLLLIGDQGFGDTIQFARYISLVAQRCPNLIVACSAEMYPIISQQPGVSQYLDRWAEMPAFDAYCPLSGLPRLFKTHLRSVPAPIPYVEADPGLVAHWRARLEMLAPPGYRRIGLTWAGRPTHSNDFNRSMALSELAPVTDTERTVFFSLQIGPGQAQVGRYFGRAPLINLGAEIRDFADTMAILTLLERLISVDTSVAHLAGAMGRPVSLLLPFAPDWRWLQNRLDTPWYPSVELVRQPSPGDWRTPIAQVAARLGNAAI